MILAAIVIARNPVQYGFPFDPETALPWDRITLPGPVDLRRVAEWVGTTIDEIRSLNPEAPALDLAGQGPPIRAEGAGRDRGASHGATRGSSSGRLGVVEMVYGQAGRVAIGDCPQVECRQDRSGRVELRVHHRSRRPRSEVDGSARSHRPHGGGDRTDSSSGRIPSDRITAGAARTGLHELEPRHGVVQGSAGDTLTSSARLLGTSVTSLKTWNRLPGNQLMTGKRLTVYTTLRTN